MRLEVQSSLALRAMANFDNATLLTPDGETPVIDLSESHSEWQTAEFQVVVDEAERAVLTRVGLYLDGNLGRQLRGVLDLDAVELLDTASNLSLMTGDAMSFARTGYRYNHMGESAAVAIDRMGAIAYWGSSSHHLTGGWSLYPSRVATLLMSGRTLGESTAYSGAKAGLVYGDPNYLGFAVSIYQTAGLSFLHEGATRIWPNTPEAKWPRLSVHNGTDHVKTLSWTLEGCTGASHPTACEGQDWLPILVGQGAVRGHRLQADAVQDVVGDQPVVLRLRAWRPNDPEQHLSDYAYLQFLEEAWVLNPLCIADVNLDGRVDTSDTELLKPYVACADAAWVYDLDGDGDVDQDDAIKAILDPGSLDLDIFDLNGDGVIDSWDMGYFLGLFSSQYCGQLDTDGTFPQAYDVNGDAVVDTTDLELVEAAVGTVDCPCESALCAP